VIFNIYKKFNLFITKKVYKNIKEKNISVLKNRINKFYSEYIDIRYIFDV